MVFPFFATAEKGAGGMSTWKTRQEGGCGGEYMQPAKMVNCIARYLIK